jgi:queuine tRNA-ribosyltransferase subunit QTRTD1
MPELVEEIEGTLLPRLDQFSLSTSYNRPGIEVLKQFQLGIKSLTKLKGHESISFCAVQDAVEPANFEYNEEKTVSVWTVSGRRKLTVDDYLEAVNVFQPDWFQCLSDVAIGSSLSRKRIRKSVDRTLRFVNQTLDHPHIKDKSVIPFGSIQGASLISERLRSARETALQPVGGFIIEGLDYRESPNDVIAEMLKQTTDLLPVRKPRVIFGPRTPEQILTAVECGVDLFDTSYPYELTEKGFALDLFTKSLANTGDEREEQPSYILDLNDKRYINYKSMFHGYGYLL